ncbi:hypothetical protein [Thermococcus barophilus]|uniref:hypothetical protein n=1 Tax=Thermococcus barophilus TaxID=55802 RepID=UPI0007047FCD|nr:hypothetical protein [Thermococcus barophilus]
MRNSTESNLKCTQKAYWNTNCGTSLWQMENFHQRFVGSEASRRVGTKSQHAKQRAEGVL